MTLAFRGLEQFVILANLLQETCGCGGVFANENPTPLFKAATGFAVSEACSRAQCSSSSVQEEPAVAKRLRRLLGIYLDAHEQEDGSQK
jgi:hypothetical protein